jgi:hypothetical protein
MKSYGHKSDSGLDFSVSGKKPCFSRNPFSLDFWTFLKMSKIQNLKKLLENIVTEYQKK